MSIPWFFQKLSTMLITGFFFKNCFIMVWKSVLWIGLEDVYVDVNTMLLMYLQTQPL